MHGILNKIIKKKYNEVHTGYDIQINVVSRRKPATKLELNDYELINGGTTVINAPSLDKQKVLELYNQVVFKYFEKHQAEDNAKFEESQTQTRVIPVNGKVIKNLLKTGSKYQLEVYDEAGPEVKDIAGQLATVWALTDIKFKEHVTKCAKTLRVGCLDIPHGENRLHIWTKEGCVPVEGSKVSTQVLRNTLWYIAKGYMAAPSFREHLSIDVSVGRYTGRYDRGVFKFDTDGLTDLEKDLIQDIMTMGQAIESK